MKRSVKKSLRKANPFLSRAARISTIAFFDAASENVCELTVKQSEDLDTKKEKEIKGGKSFRKYRQIGW